LIVRYECCRCLCSLLFSYRIDQTRDGVPRRRLSLVDRRHHAFAHFAVG
jgi:hypothetical protein